MNTTSINATNTRRSISVGAATSPSSTTTGHIEQVLNLSDSLFKKWVVPSPVFARIPGPWVSALIGFGAGGLACSWTLKGIGIDLIIPEVMMTTVNGICAASGAVLGIFLGVLKQKYREEDRPLAGGGLTQTAIAVLPVEIAPVNSDSFTQALGTSSQGSCKEETIVTYEKITQEDGRRVHERATMTQRKFRNQPDTNQGLSLKES